MKIQRPTLLDGIRVGTLFILISTSAQGHFGYARKGTLDPELEASRKVDNAPKTRKEAEPKPPAQPQPVDPQVQRREDLKTALDEKAPKSKEALDKLLNDPELGKLLGEENGEQKDKKLKEFFGKDVETEQLDQLRAQYLSETRFSDFAKEIQKLQDKQEASTGYEKALLAQAEKLAEKHKSAIEIFQAKGGQRAGNLALRLEGWERALASKDNAEAERVGKEVAGLMVSVGDRAGLQKAFAEAAGQKSASALTKNIAWAAANTSSTANDVRSRLTQSSTESGTNAIFREAFSKAWTTTTRDYAAEFVKRRNDVFETDTNGQRTVNAEKLNKLRIDYPNFTPEWAKTTGNKDNLWLSAYKPESKTWSYTPSRDMVTERKNDYKAPTIHARSSESLDQFLKAHAQSSQPMTLGAYARQAADERATAGLTDSRIKAKAVADVVDAVGRKIPPGTSQMLQNQVGKLGNTVLGATIPHSIQMIAKPVAAGISSIEGGLNGKSSAEINDAVAGWITESRRRSLDLDAMYPPQTREPAAVSTTATATQPGAKPDDAKPAPTARRGDSGAPVRSRPPSGGTPSTNTPSATPQTTRTELQRKAAKGELVAEPLNAQQVMLGLDKQTLSKDYYTETLPILNGGSAQMALSARNAQSPVVLQA